MRHLILVILVIAFVSGALVAQDKKLTVADALNAGKFVPRGLMGLAWHPDGQRYTWFAREKGDPSMLARTLDGKQSVIIGWKTLRPVLAKAGVKGASPQVLASLAWRKDGTLRLTAGKALWSLALSPVAVKKIRDLAGGGAVSVTSKEGRHVAYVKGHDVWVRKDGKKDVRVTFDGSKDLTHGVSVSRVEFGITDGLWWDPTGSRVAFYQEDFTPITDYPFVDLAPRPAKRASGRYPMAGQAGSRVKVAVFDVASENVAWLETDPKVDEYLTNVTWHPSGDRIIVAHVNRAQNRCEVVEYDARTGTRLRLLFVESDQEWIEPEHGPIWLPGKSGDFLWVSFRDGHRHLWHYRGDGRLVGQVTRGKFDFAGFDRFAPDGKGLYWITTGPNVLQKHLYYTSLDGKTQRAVTKGRGQHDALLSPQCAHLIDVHTDLELPLAIDLVDSQTGKASRIHTAKDPFKDYAKARDSFFTVKTEDGEDLHGYLVLPPTTEPGKKYPVINYVYGGPHSQLVQDRWLSGFGRWNLWLHAMAHDGYVCFIVDGRGTNNRGIEWQQSVFRRLGTLEADDQIRGLEHVLARDDTDRNRVGVTGWSYGGFMTLTMMTRKPAWYRAGVAGAPVTDWAYYETGYGERYMDTPQENRAGYKKADPGTHAKGIRGRLLVVHGTRDDTVVWQQTLSFLEKCVDAGAPVDYMAYPGHVHGLRGKAFTHFIRKLTDYFDLHLRKVKLEKGS